MEAVETRPLYHPREIARELWDRFPIVFLYAQYVGLLHFICANVDDRMFAENGVSKLGVCLTTAIPAGVVTAYYLLRVIDSKRIKSVPLAMSVILLLTVGIPLLISAVYGFGVLPKTILPERWLITGFEVSQIFWFVLIFIHSAFKRGVVGLALFWGVALLYGVILENGGIVMGYFFEGNFSLYLFRLPAPVATMFGWVMVMYICSGIADMIAERLPSVRWTPTKLALMTTGVALALDSQLDPMASLSGIWWAWNPLLEPAWFGVPFLNYVAWFSAVLPFAYAYYLVRSRKQWSPRRQVKEMLYRVLPVAMIAAILNFGIMAVYEAVTGHGLGSGPTFQIMHHFFNRILPYG